MILIPNDFKRVSGCKESSIVTFLHRSKTVCCASAKYSAPWSPKLPLRNGWLGYRCYWAPGKCETLRNGEVSRAAWYFISTSCQFASWNGPVDWSHYCYLCLPFMSFLVITSTSHPLIFIKPRCLPSEMSGAAAQHRASHIRSTRVSTPGSSRNGGGPSS